MADEMVKTITLKTLAKNTIKSFEQKERNNKEKFYCIKDGSAQWITDMVREAHGSGNVLPNDWVYDFVLDALYLISECDNEEEIEDSINEIEPSVYNSDLFNWVSSSLYFAEYVNEAVAEFGMEKFDLFTALQYGQTKQRQEVANSVLNSLREQLD